MRNRNWRGLLSWRRPNHGTRSTSSVAVTPASAGYVRPSTTAGRHVQPSMEDRVSDVEALTRAVLYVTVATMIGVLVSLGGIMLEQWHNNIDTYKEESAKAQEKVDRLNSQVEALNDNLKSLNKDVNSAKDATESSSSQPFTTSLQ